MEDLMGKMPRMMMGKELEEAMLSLPEYDPEICKADAGARLMALNDVADVYIPSHMSFEIYSKIYLSMLHSLKKKQNRDAVMQGNQNHRRLQGLSYHSVLGGSDSFSITGPSGIGKSTALAKSIALAGGEEIIITKEPYAQIIPCVNVQCPHDCSVKGLLLAILAQVDIAIGTRYEYLAVKNKASIDSLIGTVSQVALNNILLIVIDECQNICRNKGGVNLVSAMTQLINSSGVSICMVGLPETELFFSNEMQLARRSVGLSYKALPCSDYFIKFCETLFSYQYVSKPSSITPDLMELLYECTGGILALVVSLIMESQQIAILTGKEKLGKETILMAYEQRMKNIQDFVKPITKIRKQTASAVDSGRMAVPEEIFAEVPDAGDFISGILSGSGVKNMDAVLLLKEQGIIVEEVSA